MGYAFISYSSINQESADSIREMFKKNNIHTWMAPYDIPAGSSYMGEINRALLGCDCLVLMLSEAAQNSQWVLKELERAVSYKKTIIPVKIEDIVLNDDFDFVLGSCHVVAVRKIDENSDEVKKVLNSVMACTREKNKNEYKITDEIDMQPDIQPRASEDEEDEIQRLKSLFLVEDPFIAIEEKYLSEIIEGNNYKLHRFHGEINDYKDYTENCLKKVLKDADRIVFNIRLGVSENELEFFSLAESMTLDVCVNEESIVSWGYVKSNKLKPYEIEVDIIASKNKNVFEIEEKDKNNGVLITAAQQKRLNLYACGICGMPGEIKRDSIGYYVECSCCEATSTISNDIDKAIDNWGLCALYDKVSKM